MPQPPGLDALAEAFPSLQRPLYAQALALGTALSPAMLACSCALLASLVRENLAARDDARIVAARLAAVLGCPQIGYRLTESWTPASHVHRSALEQARRALDAAPARALSAWPAWLAETSRLIIAELEKTRGTWLGIGPSASLSVLFGPLDSRFEMSVARPQSLLARFSDEFPRTLVVAEPVLSADIASFVRPYAALPIDTLVCVTEPIGMLELDGFSAASQTFAVPGGRPLRFFDPFYTRSPAFSPPAPETDAVRLTMHVWTRIA